MKAGQTLLLVDAQPSVRKVTRTVAAREGLRLLEADDGQEGLDLARAEVPDLVLIRRDSPVLDALSVTVLLKQAEATRSIPVVVLCAEATALDVEHYHDAGVDDYILLPLTEHNLLEKLETWLP
ncbi:response regulator [Dissulfurirhabdus thermomarina]|uniref:Response regulator n=1 Tax=Dissulfurirhabdus thermomarina TaxID=1765737 RepID=A0A6N9TPJ0_DISTH|nr:response regulator [Dissulfurirhabdus thermomarina]NDY42968.1 response regulator [Dissulfurirhabdus thermomarina]NMX23953.1 response regulator [Dissulfurirhabdus thermomarina]